MDKTQANPIFLILTLAAMLLARITLYIAYRITYPFLPVIARGLGVDISPQRDCSSHGTCGRRIHQPSTCWPAFGHLGPQAAVARRHSVPHCISYRITYPFLPVIARGLGVNLTSAGLLVTARAAGGLASPIFGPLSDTWGRKRLMLAGVALLIAGAAICAALPFYAAFLVAFVTFGLAKAIYDPTMQAVHRRPRALRAARAGDGHHGAFVVGGVAAGRAVRRMAHRARGVAIAVRVAGRLGRSRTAAHRVAAPA